MTKLIIILIAGLFCEAIGVVLLNKGIKQVGEVQQISYHEVVRVVKSGITNRHILLGVFFEFIFFITLLVLMSKGDVSFIWPLTALGFVITTLAAKYYLHEEVSTLRWAGVVLIVAGAALITLSEKIKERAAKAQVIPAVITPDAGSRQ